MSETDIFRIYTCDCQDDFDVVSCFDGSKFRSMMCTSERAIRDASQYPVVASTWHVGGDRRYHGTEEVTDGGRFTTSLELDQKLYHLARLRIDSVAKGDAGEYRAVAKNKHGQGVATINLNFEGGDRLK